ncbi:MAG: hypothetical protein ACHQT8_01270 [Chlamydiales bacterium]
MAAFGESFVYETELQDQCYHFWIPMLNENRALCSRRDFGSKFHVKEDYSKREIQICDQDDATCAIKTFRACSTEQISRVLRRLFVEKEWNFESCAQFFEDSPRPAVHIVKISSRHISYAAFHSARGGTPNTGEMMLKIDGIWKKFGCEIIPESGHDCHRKGSKLPCYVEEGEIGGCNRVALEHRDAVKKWPWMVSFDLGGTTLLNLTSNPPHFRYQGSTFSVEPVCWTWNHTKQLDRMLGLSPHTQKRRGRDYARGEQLSCISPVLFLPEETAYMTRSASQTLTDFGLLPLSLIQIVEDYWYPEELTLS